jgi:hypothetical protein
MEFDWENLPFDWTSSLTPRDVEESFEDPFAVRLLPDSPRFAAQSRYFNLGRSASGLGVFSVYRTNGRQFRVICARSFTPEEQFFYQKKLNQSLAS